MWISNGLIFSLSYESIHRYDTYEITNADSVFTHLRCAFLHRLQLNVIFKGATTIEVNVNANG